MRKRKETSSNNKPLGGVVCDDACWIMSL